MIDDITDPVPDAADAARAEAEDPDAWAEDIALLFSERDNTAHDAIGCNTNGYYAHMAASDQCLALGHFPNPETREQELEDIIESWDFDGDHPLSWDHEPLCAATKYDVACSEHEGQCDGLSWLLTKQKLAGDQLWRKVRADA